MSVFGGICEGLSRTPSRVERAAAERIAVLRHIVLRNAAHDRGVEVLTNEPDAARLLILASNSAYSFLVLGSL
jgi:hypothetical protein